MRPRKALDGMRRTGYLPYPVPDGSFAGQTILLTDGDDPVSRGLAAAFAALGGDVFVAAEGETAVSAFDSFERPIDLLVNCRWQRTLGPAEDKIGKAWCGDRVCQCV